MPSSYEVFCTVTISIFLGDFPLENSQPTNFRGFYADSADKVMVYRFDPTTVGVSLMESSLP